MKTYQDPQGTKALRNQEPHLEERILHSIFRQMETEKEN